MKLKAFSKNLVKKRKPVSIRYRINLLKFKIFFVFLKDVYLYNIFKRYKSILMILFLLIPFTIRAENIPQRYSFIGENFRITSVGENFSPAIASNGEDLFLVVYYRKNTDDFDIYGTRVTVDGEVLDPEGIPISTAPGDQMFPSVTWNGENFFVVWQDYRSGKNWDIFGSRVSIFGEILDPGGIPLVLGKPKLDNVSPVISEGFLVWQGRKNPKIWNIYFKNIGNDGEGALEKTPIPVSPSSNSQIYPSIIFNGSIFFIIWQDKRSNDFWEIYGARITPWGKVIDKKGIKISEELHIEKWRPAGSWNKDHYLVLWMASPDNKKWSLYGRRVNIQGQPLDLFDLPIKRGETNKAFPAITYTGGENLIVFEDEPEDNPKISALPLVSGYKAILGDTFLISTDREIEKSGFPCISSIENRILIVWQGKGVEEPYQIYGQILSIVGEEEIKD